jgi:hypothetical protein
VDTVEIEKKRAKLAPVEDQTIVQHNLMSMNISPIQGKVPIIETISKRPSVDHLPYCNKSKSIKTRSSNSENSQHASPKKSPSNTKDNYENVLLAQSGEQRKWKRSRTTKNTDLNPYIGHQKVKSSDHTGREVNSMDSTNPMLSQERNQSNPSDSDSPS